MEEEFREKFVYEAIYGNGRDFVEVDPVEGGGSVLPDEWVQDKDGTWKSGGVKALRVRERATNRVVAINLLEFPGIQPVKLVSVTGEYQNAPMKKSVYSNVINIGVSPTELMIDFGRMRVDKIGDKNVNVGVGQVAVIMTYETAQGLRDTLDSILKARLVGGKK